MAYEPVIGLEIHVQLRTQTKMFCGCALSFGEEPNTRTCPICLGHPGVLPVINAEAVHYALMIGMALECEIADDFRAAFERVDLVVTPTSPTVAFGLGERTDDPLAMYLSDALTVPMPLAGIPAISIPTGMSDGLPVGFQIAGPAFSENRILEAAYAVEQAVGFDGAPPRA